MNAIITAIHVISAFLSSRWGIVSTFMGALYYIYEKAAGVFTLVETMISEVDALILPALNAASVSVSPFGLMNYLLPLDTAIVWFGIWVAFYLTCVAIRSIKAWIPTVSS